MTYNIRLDTSNDGENAWTYRKEALLQQIVNNKIDIFGIQEGLPHQVVYCDSVLVNYNYVGVGRDDGNTGGEYSAIFFNKNKFQVVKQHTFWLSETPSKPSKGWDAAYPRICTYVLLKNRKSQKLFWVFNTHFDHIGIEARQESAKLIINKITEINTNNYPVVLLGDFNLTEDSTVIQYLNSVYKDSKYVVQQKTNDTLGTFNGFNVQEQSNNRIDYIFVSEQLINVKKYQVLRQLVNGKYPSDHFPVIVNLKL
jgi:endonuclease/exonuclease/phosphatase family metal-dependent hydrolase